MPPKKAAKKSATSKAAGGTTAAGKKGKKASVKREVSVESSSSSASSSVSGKLPDDVQCGICHDLLHGAMQTPCCGGLSCRECIEAVAATTNACPYCRATALYADKLLRDVRVERAATCYVSRCKYDGCDYRGKRDELKAHMVACDKRPRDEVIAELREAEMRWRRQRCWQLSSIIKFYEDDSWSDEILIQLEQLMCRVHTFGSCCDPGDSEESFTVDQPEVDPLDRLMPPTTARIYNNAGSPYVRISHTEDEDEPTWCYAIVSHDPRSARQIVIPAKAADSVILRDFVHNEACGATDGACACEACNCVVHDDEDAPSCACIVTFYLAKTLGDFGLTEGREYAHAGINPY